MSSPDFSDYVDLTIYDEVAADILNDILVVGRGLIPQWQPEAGQIEVVLAEAFADKTAALVAAINRLPDATAQTLLQLFGITRSSGVKATGSALFTFTDTNGYTIPADTPLAWFSNSTSYVYVTQEDLIVGTGASTGSVDLVAQAVGYDYNSALVNDALQVLVTLPYVSSVVFDTAPSGGQDVETNEQYLDRGTNLLASYSSALATPSQIQAYVLDTYAVVYRCQVFDKRRYRDRDTTATGYTTHPGYALVAVAGQNADPSDTSDVTVSAGNLALIESDVESRTTAGLGIDMMSAELVRITVTADFNILPGLDAAELETAVGNALDAYLDPNEWDWSKQFVRVNEIIALIDNVTGVDYVNTVSLAGASVIGSSNFSTSGNDIQLDNLGTLVIAGTHSLTATVST